MGAHLITGYAGKEHITSADQGAFNAGIAGTEKYVMETASMFECEQVNSNLIKIHAGDLINQGRHIRIDVNDYVECTIDNGLQGLKRNDLIVMRYSKNKDTDIENAEVLVLKGTSGETAADPDYLTGDILNGDTEDDFLLYRVKLDGIEVKSVEPLFDTIVPVKKMQDGTNDMLLERIYPVGSIYMSVNNISPSAFLGGKWTQIQNTFLLAAGSSYAAGSTGGEATHMLTLNEMPSHSHAVDGHTKGADSTHTHTINVKGTTSSSGLHSHRVGVVQDVTTGGNKGRISSTSVATTYHNSFESGEHTHTVTITGETDANRAGHTHEISGDAKATGGNYAHNNMPPYLSVYMWKRTA